MTTRGFVPLPPGPSGQAAAVTPSDTAVFSSATRGIYVGGAGDLTVIPAGQTTPVTLKAVPVGAYLPISVLQVMATNTTATLIVAWF